VVESRQFLQYLAKAVAREKEKEREGREKKQKKGANRVFLTEI